MTIYLALLRGINVGGNNLIKMPDLAACFETLGFSNVRTYIQSGNVIFSTTEPDQSALTSMIEATLDATFGAQIPVVIRSAGELKSIVSDAPDGFGSEPAIYSCDIIFLKDSLTSAEAMQWVSVRDGVDQVQAGSGVIYFSKLVSKASRSHMSRIISTPVYKNMTIRRWGTVSKLLGMMQSEGH